MKSRTWMVTNFRMIASAIDNTENTVKAIKAAYGRAGE